MNEPKCVWNKKLANVAVETVLTLGRTMVFKRIPGETFVYMTGEGADKKPLGPAVSKKRILSVFNWIISQTNGFRFPLLVNFRHGDAPTIAMGMIRSFSPDLSNELYALEKAGLRMPRIDFGWHNGPSSPFMLISNLERSKGNMGFDLYEVRTISVHGTAQRPERIILLKNIPS